MKLPDQGWRVVLASMVSLMVGTSSIIFFTQGLFLQPMTHEFGWSPSGYFSAVLVSGVASAAVMPLIGNLADRFSVRCLIISGILFFAAGNVALGFIGNSLAVYVALIAITNVLGIPQTPLLYAKVISTWFDKRRGIALAVAFCGSALGGICVPPFASWLITDFGWRIARFGLAATVLVFALPAVIFFVREADSISPGKAPHCTRMSGAELALADCLRSTTLWLIAGAFFMASAVANAVLVHLVPLLMKEGVTLPIATTSLSVLAAAQVVGRFAAGASLDRFQTAKVGIAWFIPAACGVGMLLRYSGAVAALPAATLVGLSYGAELEMAGVFISRIFGLSHFAFLYGIVFAAYVLGASIGPTIVAVITGKAGSYGHALLVLLLLEGVASLLLLFVRPYRYLPGLTQRTS